MNQFHSNSLHGCSPKYAFLTHCSCHTRMTKLKQINIVLHIPFLLGKHCHFFKKGLSYRNNSIRTNHRCFDFSSYHSLLGIIMLQTQIVTQDPRQDIFVLGPFTVLYFQCFFFLLNILLQII